MAVCSEEGVARLSGSPEAKAMCGGLLCLPRMGLPRHPCTFLSPEQDLHYTDGGFQNATGGTLG